MTKAEIRATLQQRYRSSINKTLAATNPEDRDHWAAVAAVAISELQHPALREAA